MGAVALHILGGENQLVPLSQGDGTVFKRLDADLGAFGVQHGGHRAAQLIPDAAQAGQGGKVAFVGAMGEVEAGTVHAGEDQLADHVLAVHRRAQSADDLCLSHVHSDTTSVGVQFVLFFTQSGLIIL